MNQYGIAVEDWRTGGGGRIVSEYNLELSRYHPAYFAFLISDTNEIFVGTHEKLDGKDIYDVFDEEGRLVTRIPLKKWPLVMKKSQLYSIEDDEEGYQVVKRYRVTWNY